MKGFTIEFINSFAFVYFSGMTSGIHFENGADRGLGALLLIPFLIWMSKHNNGSTFNPSISITALILKYENLKQTLIHLGAQFLGCLIGAGFVHLLINKNEINYENRGSVFILNNYYFTGFFIEFIGAIFLSIITFATFYNPKSNQKIAGLAIGSFYSTFIMGFFIITGGCLNFIRTLFSSIFIGKHFYSIIIYISAHLVGSILGGLIYKYLFKKINEEIEEEVK